MPESITVAGVDLKLRSFTPGLPTYRGSEGEAFDNTRFRGTDAPKRNWTGETVEYPTSTETALRVLVDAGPVVCSGLVMFGGSVTCLVRIESAPQSWNTFASSLEVTLSLSFKEV